MRKVLKFIIGICFIAYIFVLVILLFFESRGTETNLSFLEYIKRSSNFIPFNTIYFYVQAMFNETLNINIILRNIIGNIIAFMPMGVFLPIFIRKLNSVTRFTISMIVLILCIETIQAFTRRGSFDIDDLILNVFGALLVFTIWRSNIVKKLVFR
ncbi:VanZ family protein [Gracilibacillus lacisalsi]|uniref:VanZ family protein n=1 Tax=Gracilibacillus lacisalsi TaxID=393087 RepID=UPI0003810161|nr:VanZ family protein [Gracilibacillus lacisalsi]